ncbi:unnamed protein product [Cuscuta campestris]|uniref:DNA replication checkpoint mediator MRC1 domain-containing protein n=1 Tax=Cuscuta campestris TaxID=132261 RepID=A0A484NQZ5_9ASTE|nr:unnamed protein product [Cuscuta campestris]
MESFDDYESFSPPVELPPLLKTPSFKRLKKPGRAAENPPATSIDDVFAFPQVDFAKLEALEASETLVEDSDDSEGPRLPPPGLDDDSELKFDSVGKHNEARRVLSSDEENGLDMNAEGLRSVGENGEESVEAGEGLEDRKLEIKESKRKKSADSNSNGSDKSKSKKAKVDDGVDLKPKESAPNKGREQKERKQSLQQLHAETQRLLRETRDASFKPIPVVHKPISSVLQKIRQRKLEISKKSISLTNSYSLHTNNGGVRKKVAEEDLDNISKEHFVVEISENMTESQAEDSKNVATGPSVPEADADHESVSSQAVLDEVAQPMFRAPVDTQDIFGDSQDIDETNETPKCNEDSSPLEEIMAPSVLAMKLKFDSIPPDECSSDEEDHHIEDIDQNPDLDCPPKGDPVKLFVDEEAEEDDSDNDAHRFDQNEDDEDIDDFEEVKDMIATNFEEKPSDNERRNDLHRKWLEQQDAVGTENLLQKLKFGSKHKETALLDDEQVDSESEEFNDDAEEEAQPMISARLNKRKAKQIITQMFMEKDDVFLSDDEEEKDRMIIKQHALIRAEDQTTLVSPIEDENSKTFFGLIKKLNTVPDKKKKAKPSSYFEKILGGSKDKCSSKSSFLGRATKRHIPVPNKQSSCTFRSFIFERDDSNSRTSFPMSDDSSHTVVAEKHPTKNSVAKFSGSQAKYSTPSKSSGEEISSGLSLFDIRPSPPSLRNEENDELFSIKLRGLLSRLPRRKRS